MKELFEQLPKSSVYQKNVVLIDTCFFIDMFRNDKRKEFASFCDQHTVAFTSFNVEEFLYNIHQFSPQIKDGVRKFLKQQPNLNILQIPLMPGNRKEEEDFIKSVEPALLKLIPDPSDAVLMAVAILTHATILTKDKHHLFTTKLENYLQQYGLRVHKELRDV